jgi:UDP-N-acetylglucosamine 2-epimerase (non-hydrolysing)
VFKKEKAMEKKKKIMAVVNTRPDAIKMCPLVKELKNREELSVVLCSTGQHRELLSEALEIFSVTPDYDLGIMRERQDLSYVTVSVINGI